MRLNEEVKKVKSLKEGISLFQRHKNLLKDANQKVINIFGKQGELLKRLNEEDDFINTVGLSSSNIYFKVRLFKFLCKFSMLDNLTLTRS